MKIMTSAEVIAKSKKHQDISLMPVRLTSSICPDREPTPIKCFFGFHTIKSEFWFLDDGNVKGIWNCRCCGKILRKIGC